MRFNHFARKILLAGTAISLPLAPAFAQSSEGGISEIVVTAQKREQSLQKVPIAVTALTSNELAKANIDGQQALPKLTPNMNLTVIASFASVYIRGVGTQYANPGLESSVAVYLDDTYMPRANNGMFTLNDVARVEVLKGPQGTLYGRNATGGAVRIITNDPKYDRMEVAASATYGSRSRMVLDGMINIPLGDNAALRVTGRHDQRDGHVRNLAPGARQKRLGNRNEELYMAKLHIDATPEFKIKLSGDYSRKNDSEGHNFTNLYPGAPEQLGIALGGCGQTASFYTICNDNNASLGQKRLIGQNIESYGATLRLEYDLGSSTLSSTTAFRKTEENNTADLDSTGAPLQIGAGNPWTKQFTQELQIASDGSSDLNYVAGLYYLREKSGYFFSVSGLALDGALLFPNAALGGDGAQKATSWAPYFQFDWKFADKLTLTAGARYTKEKKKLLYNDVVAGPVNLDTGFPIESLSVRTPMPLVTRKFKQFTPKVTLSYEPADRVMVYATYARGFKSGGLNLPAFGPVDSVKPEILDDFEIGWKMQTGTIRFNGAAFYYKYKDLQIQITDQTTGGTRVVNAAKADIKGIEADLTWAPDDALEVGIGGGYLDTKYKNFIGDAYIPCSEDTVPSTLPGCVGQGGAGLSLLGGQNLSGNRLVNSPKFSGYIRAQYTADLGNSGSLTVGSILNHRSKAYFDVASRFVDKARTMLSASLVWSSADEHFTAGLYGENLTDKKYVTINQPQNTGGWKIQGLGREILFRVGFKY